MERETVGRKRKGPGAACPRGGWGLPSGRGGVGGRAGRGSSARVKSSKSLEIQAWKPEMHTARRPGEFGQSGFLAALGLFFSAQERQPQHGFSACPCRLKGFAPHPGAGSRTGTAPEPGYTLLSHKTAPPSLPFLLLTTSRERWSGIWPTGSLILALNTTLRQAHLPSPSWQGMK